MKTHFLLWSSGPDRPGIVSAVTQSLFKFGMNLEDSSMMRLGAEFGIFLIFTSDGKPDLDKLTASLRLTGKRFSQTIGIKKISAKEAAGRAPKITHIVSVHGPDRPGIVFNVTSCLAKRGFNITDLSTHRTTSGKQAGYILFIEGEIKGTTALSSLKKDLHRIQRALKTKIDIRPIESSPL